MASVGKGGPVASNFEGCADVPRAGVLLALPALLASGLWKHTQEHFSFRLPDLGDLNLSLIYKLGEVLWLGKSFL